MSPTILIVDDSITVRMDLAQTFEEAGYSTKPCATLTEARSALLSGDISLVILDVLLPDGDGVDFLQWIRLSEWHDLPVMILSVDAEVRDRIRGLRMGADEYIAKPYVPGHLLARAQQLLHLKKTRIGTVLIHPGRRDGIPTPAGSAEPKNILAVDDSPTYLQMLAEVMREEGYVVMSARSGEEALELLALQTTDCILLDVLMPGLGGLETCRKIKAAPGLRDIPLIMLTASEEREAVVEGLGAGADDYIAKSSDFEVVSARVRTQIRRQQSENENRRYREQVIQMEMEAVETRAARELAETKSGFARDLERKNKELEAFNYTVSHDLRVPLRSLNGFSQALLEDCGGMLDEKGKDHIRRIREASVRMDGLIEALLQVSRLERSEMKREQVDLGAMAAAVAADLRRAEPDRKVDFTVLEGMGAWADGRLMRSLLENLIGNAWKFTRKRDGARVEFGRSHQGGEDAFFIRDNGAGFDMGQVDGLFLPFKRLHSAAEFPGTGIGLTSVRWIVERHGGRIWAEGKVGEGAVFYWTLPQVPDKT
jgi:DNA-binding response OmpR family regulator